MEKRTRRIKLHAQTRSSRTSATGLKNVPWLNVSGIWLEKAGFKPGDQVEIRVKEKELVIKTTS